MQELLELLSRKLSWVDSTYDAKRVQVTLTRDQLADLVALTKGVMMQDGRMDCLPIVEPRMLSRQEPAGTRLSAEQAAKMYSEMQSQKAENQFKYYYEQA